MPINKKNKTGLDKKLLSIGISFTIILFLLKLTVNFGTWLNIFYPLIFIFILIFLLKLFKKFDWMMLKTVRVVNILVYRTLLLLNM